MHDTLTKITSRSNEEIVWTVEPQAGERPQARLGLAFPALFVDKIVRLEDCTALQLQSICNYKAHVFRSIVNLVRLYEIYLNLGPLISVSYREGWAGGSAC
jgi:hypothetical protein